MHLILSAREWWCEPGEPISWAVLDPFRVPLFEVNGLNEHGQRQRGILTRAAFQVGAMAYRVSGMLNDEDSGQRLRPSAVVVARGSDGIAVRLTGSDGRTPPGQDPGVLVATPERLALLEVAENPEPSPAWLETVKNYGGGVYRLVEDFGGTVYSTDNTRGRNFDHKGRTRTPRVVEKAGVAMDEVAGYEIVHRKFARLGYDKDDRAGPYLRVTFTDGSWLDLECPSGITPEQVPDKGSTSW